MNTAVTPQWLLDSAEPWTRYRALRDLLGRPEEDAEVSAPRAALLVHPQVQGLIARAATWPGRPILRHNDAGHPLYALSTLADFGLTAADPGLECAAEVVLAHQAPAGALQSVLNSSIHRSVDTPPILLTHRDFLRPVADNRRPRAYTARSKALRRQCDER